MLTPQLRAFVSRVKDQDIEWSLTNSGAIVAPNGALPSGIIFGRDAPFAAAEQQGFTIHDRYIISMAENVPVNPLPYRRERFWAHCGSASPEGELRRELEKVCGIGDRDV